MHKHEWKEHKNDNLVYCWICKAEKNKPKGRCRLNFINGVAELPKDFVSVKEVTMDYGYSLPWCNRHFIYTNIAPVHRFYNELPKWFIDDTNIYLVEPYKNRFRTRWQKIKDWFKGLFSVKTNRIYHLEYINAAEWTKNSLAYLE